eukprot:TRINITY_DN742_c0_g1_i1.p2 TRINITY_DN742_c0_g1~~TRINITY_DN742_c0_g1_i1.p2  ORF type:complete len:118 (-),score=8.05 TRINITY_DN742_c0_g1_i1:101-454(-)
MQIGIPFKDMHACLCVRACFTHIHPTHLRACINQPAYAPIHPTYKHAQQPSKALAKRRPGETTAQLLSYFFAYVICMGLVGVILKPWRPCMATVAPISSVNSTKEMPGIASIMRTSL